MKRAIDFILGKAPAISAEYKVEPRYDKCGLHYWVYQFADIELPSEMTTEFKRMWHSAVVRPMPPKGFGVELSLRWETIQGGKNGITIFKNFLEASDEDDTEEDV